MLVLAMARAIAEKWWIPFFYKCWFWRWRGPSRKNELANGPTCFMLPIMKKLLCASLFAIAFASVASANSPNNLTGIYSGTARITGSEGQDFTCPSASLELKFNTRELTHGGLSLKCDALNIQGQAIPFQVRGWMRGIGEIWISEEKIGSVRADGFEIRYCESEQGTCIEMSLQQNADGSLRYDEAVLVDGTPTLETTAQLRKK